LCFTILSLDSEMKFGYSPLTMTKRKTKQTASARMMRRATAFARNAAKASRAGNHGQAEWYMKMYWHHRDKAERMREREKSRG
jgi:hypothetical protein